MNTREIDKRQPTTTMVVGRRGDTLGVRRCQLEVLSGPRAGTALELAGQTITIGRGKADLSVEDPQVSALHAEIRLDRDGYRIRDLGSTNGTWLQGVRVFDAMLSPGVVIALGGTKLRLVPLEGSLELPLWKEHSFCGLIGKSVAMRRLFEMIERVAASDSTVLITGETGTGKELVAEAIHQRSPRARDPFVVLDCVATPDPGFEARLFGGPHMPAGALEAAAGGTLFLDEIGEVPRDVQPKLLRAVESRRISRPNMQPAVDANVRLIVATQRDLAAEVNAGTFRADLYYRVGVVTLRVPPLRERLEDLELLIPHFLAMLPKPHGHLSPEFFDWARRHAWPGNVRELRNAIETELAIPSAAGALAAAPGAQAAEPVLNVDVGRPFKVEKQRAIDAFDRQYVTRLLETHRWNISAAARVAQMDRLSIYKIMQRLSIRVPENRP